MGNKTETVKEIVTEILEALGVSGSVFVSGKDNSVDVQISDTEPGLLIGYKGETLKALQYVTRLLCFAKLKEECPTIIVDVENYRKNEEEKLKSYVQKMADLVKKTGQEEILRPMSSYKRRLIHMFISEIPGVVTESQGEGSERCVVIKPEK